MELEQGRCTTAGGTSPNMGKWHEHEHEHESSRMACKGEAGESIAGLLATALDQLDEAIFIIRSNCQLIHANRLAMNLLDKKIAFAISQGHLIPAHDFSWVCWTDWVRRASISSMVEIRSLPCESHLIVNGLPLDHASDPSLVMIRCCESAESAKNSASISAALYRLTHREQKVLESLLNGLCPKRIALQDHVAISTIRSQIKAVLSKSRHKSVQSLIALVSKFR